MIHIGRGKMVIVLSILTILSISLSTYQTADKVDFLPNQISSPAADYWPTENWLNSTPEEQGMNPVLLNEMMNRINEHNVLIDSILIVRNGYLVFEEYPRTLYDLQSRHIIHSCTKSYTSALVGIAIKEGYIDSVNSKLIDLLPNRTIANLDERKQAITLEDLLTMTSGLEWDEWSEPYNSNLNSLRQAQLASNNVQHILDLPMAYVPGEQWVYSSGSSHLLGAIVAEATGLSLFEYAMEKLFTPLGIAASHIYWPRDNQGFYWGHGGVEMIPRDMAKFGYLFLNNGTWDGKQIIPSEWVKQSAATQVTFSEYEGYSYQWWTFSSDTISVYTAQGYAGQFIFVVPSLDMVVVFTSSVPPYEAYPQPSLLFEYIIPAAMNDIPQHVVVTSTMNLATLVSIPLPILFAWVYYRLRIKNWSQLSNEIKEMP